MFAIRNRLLRVKLIRQEPVLPVQIRFIHHKFNLVQPNYDTEYLLNPTNIPDIQYNIEHRKGVGNIQLVHELNDKLKGLSLSDETERNRLNDQLQAELRKIPNRTHPELLQYGNQPKLIRSYREKPAFGGAKIFEFAEMAKKLNVLRMEKLGNFTGHKSYYLTGDLAELVQLFSIDEMH